MDLVGFRDTDEKWQNELGPMRIPKIHLLVRELIKQFQLRVSLQMMFGF